MLKRFVRVGACFLVALALILLPWIVLAHTCTPDYLCSHQPWRMSQSCVEYRTHQHYRQRKP